jgi:hypothetical protein
MLLDPREGSDLVVSRMGRRSLRGMRIALDLMGAFFFGEYTGMKKNLLPSL